MPEPEVIMSLFKTATFTILSAHIAVFDQDGNVKRSMETYLRSMTTVVRANAGYLFIANVLLIYEDRMQERAESMSCDLGGAMSAERSSTRSADLGDAESARQRNTKASVTWCHVTRRMDVRGKM